jgi:hypothetical protein
MDSYYHHLMMVEREAMDGSGVRPLFRAEDIRVVGATKRGADWHLPSAGAHRPTGSALRLAFRSAGM